MTNYIGQAFHYIWGHQTIKFLKELSRPWNLKMFFLDLMDFSSKF